MRKHCGFEKIKKNIQAKIILFSLNLKENKFSMQKIIKKNEKVNFKEKKKESINERRRNKNKNIYERHI